MTRLSKIIAAQGKFLLENYWHAFLCALVFSLLPYAAWLSSVLIALVTLRRGEREGGVILLAVLIAHTIFSVAYLPANVAAAQTALFFIPCYVAAFLLRITKSWRAVAAGLFVLAMMMVFVVQLFMPSVIAAQFQLFKMILKELKADTHLLELVRIDPLFVANILFGIQTTVIVLSAVISLMAARWLQSLIYYPGGFGWEMRNFRADKIGLFLLGIVLIAAYFDMVLAINLLPLLMFYFVMAGLSLGYNLLAQKKPLGTFFLLITPVIFLPYVMLPFYLVFGSLDSLFNFRIYLAKRARK
ncbi:hypothetical protein [Legionella impletisoli]|uniref:Transmembrane protein n=1 Tax=Legionella impletisoli TaxID=343510 RepID=A0A917JQP8_9GAMM|nr:hypothetical protein [Legionella impletisoli]GGI77140.1 hypothetical protein GCM10007966_02320 [Legionella impletisoli]